MEANLGWIIFAFVLYFFAHVLRSFRFWVFLNDSRLSFRLTFMVVYTTAVMGYWIPVVLSEIFRIVILGKVLNRFSKAFMTEAITRTLDLLLLGAFSVLMEMALRETSIRQSKLFNLGLLSLFLAVVLIAFLSSLRVLFSPIKRLLINRRYGNIGVQIFRSMDTLEQASHQSFKEATPLLLLGLGLSCVIWVLDVLAVTLLLHQGTSLLDIRDSFETWISRSFASILSNAPGLVENANLINSQLLVPQSIACIALIGIFGITLIRKKGTT